MTAATKVNAALESAIERLLRDDPTFCPTPVQMDRYERMPISADLLDRLADRVADRCTPQERNEG